MVVMMQLDAQEAAIITKNPTDCKKLGGEIATYAKSTAEKRKTINAWWDGLSKGKRQKLLDAHKSDSYVLPMAMMKAVTCLDDVKTGMHSAD